jgi:hypothetical protein
MLNWLRRMIHSLIVLAMLTWLVVNGPGVIFILDHVDLKMTKKDSRCCCFSKWRYQAEIFL